LANNFLYSTRDLKFILEEWLDAQKVFGFASFREHFSIEDINLILNQMYKIAAEKIVPTNNEGDKFEVSFENGKVKVAPSFHALYKFLNTEGWGIANLDENAEGTLPQILYSAVMEMITASNPAFIPYLNLSGGAAELIQSYGQDWAKETFLPRMFAGDWSGTMCLTEANGGSDVGDILTRAYPTSEQGVYRIKGSKVFITAGDHDICENIIHMVLARTEGAAEGTKGLSLFIVPKFWVNSDGSLGEPNDVVTVGVEHKLGIRGSATTALNFGENNGCRGILIGEPPSVNGVAQGMAQMFKMMNGARMDTGQAGYTLASVAYFNAVDYARNRIQGRNPQGERVPIIQHADIRRMLLGMKAATEAMRAMAFKTFYYFDLSRHSDDMSERQVALDRIEVATPLVKAYCSDMAWPLIGDAIQVYGGYGYSEEYPVAQLARDCKIYSLWEGTNYIQSMDLVGRKWNLEQGQIFQDWINDIAALLECQADHSDFTAEVILMQRALNSYNHIRQLIVEYKTQGLGVMLPLFATRILHATAQLYCGTLILDQAVLAAHRAKQTGSDHWDYSFYQGKIEAARFYIHNVVPAIFTLETILENGDASAIAISEAALGV